MRIKLLRTIGKKDTLPKSSDNPASPELPFKENGAMYQENEVAEFDAADAEKLIKSGNGVETTDPVGLPTPAPAFGQQPTPADAPKRTDSRGGATGGPPSSGDAPKGGK